MKISICITYYNQKDFVRQSLDSVLAIDYPNIEILCGDDGSTDGTLEIIKEYAAKHSNIAYFVQERNNISKTVNRASANRLNLVTHATGKYIMFLDGDDFYCDKTFVREAIDILEQDKKLIASAFNFNFFYTNGSKKKGNFSMRTGIQNTFSYVAKCHYTHSGAVVFRNILSDNSLRLKFLQEKNNFDDNTITIYMLQFGRLYYIDKPVYVYRQTANSLWNSLSVHEQNIINVMDCRLISDMVSCYKYALIVRQRRSFMGLFLHRKALPQLLGEKYTYYLDLVRQNNDTLSELFLTWNSSTWKAKIHLIWQYMVS